MDSCEILDEEAFEKYLTDNLGLIIESVVIYEDEGDKNCCLYLSEHLFNYPLLTKVSKRTCSEKYLDGMLESLSCGGNFHALRIFIDGKDQAFTGDWQPNTSFTDVETRYKEYLTERINDMDETQLRDLVEYLESK